MIFVDVHDVTITVSGDTYPINRLLGGQGLGMTFNKNKKRWAGRVSLKALETLADQSGATLSPEAIDMAEQLKTAVDKRAKYLAGKVAAMA